MKAQSFESQLRNTTPPAPDPGARLRARRAALAEFERAATPSDLTGTLGLPRNFRIQWTSRNALLSGIASVCVVVIGASLVWLLPTEQRQIPVQVPVTNDVQSESERPQETAKKILEPLVNAQPAEASGKTEEHSTTPGTQPQRVPEKPQSRLAQSHRPAQQPSAPRVAQSSLPQLQSAPLPPPVPPEPADADVREGEVILESARLQLAQGDASRPLITAAEKNKAANELSKDLEAVTVTGSRVEQKRLFARRVAAFPVPQTLIPYESRDKFQPFDANPVKRVADDPVSTFSIDVDTASYSFVRRMLNESALPQADAVRVEEMINYFDYAWPVPDSRDPPFKPTVTVSDSPWGEGKKLLHIGIKGYELPARQQPDVNLVMLIDVSGSMSSPDKLPLVKQSMALLLDSLKPTDTVAIVVYAGAAGEVLPPTPVKDKEEILDALSALEAGGSTAGAEGIRLAYELAEDSFRKEGVNRILLATDGDFNVGISDHNELKRFVERKREKGVYLSVLGFGQGNYRDEMAQALAQNGNGVAAYIDTLSEAKKVLVQQSTASLFTIAKDVKIQLELNPATVAEYRLVGYETRALNREDFNNDLVDAGDVGSGHTVTAIYEITPVGSKAKLIDERRYAEPESAAADSRVKAKEYGFLKIRYKLPNGTRSQLLEQPIPLDTGVPAALRKDVEFSTAVAGFAQLLRGGKYTGSLTFEDVIRQAQDSLGNDPYGYRAELVRLVHKARRITSRSK